MSESDLAKANYLEQRKVGSVPGRKEDGAVSAVAASKAAVDPIPGDVWATMDSCRHIK